MANQGSRTGRGHRRFVSTGRPGTHTGGESQSGEHRLNNSKAAAARLIKVNLKLFGVYKYIQEIPTFARGFHVVFSYSSTVFSCPAHIYGTVVVVAGRFGRNLDNFPHKSYQVFLLEKKKNHYCFLLDFERTYSVSLRCVYFFFLLENICRSVEIPCKLFSSYR